MKRTNKFTPSLVAAMPRRIFCGNWFVGLSESRHKETIRKKINF
jgi:hypothetical protein